MQELGEVLHEYIFSGGIKKGGTWGGDICAAAIDPTVNIQEAAVWIVGLVLMYIVFNFKQKFADLSKRSIDILKEPTKIPAIFGIMDKVFAFIHFGMWFQVLYYKINLRSLANLLQPCHISLLTGGFAVTSKGPTSVLLSLLFLPMTSIG